MRALRSEEILLQEAREILAHRNNEHRPTISETEHTNTLYRKLNESKFAALCLSGGGIRSAAFSLGIIQALAAFPRWPTSVDRATVSDPETITRAKKSLLASFDYLSTVSGGGYVGSWLSAWCSRDGFQRVWEHLVARPEGADVEPRQIDWLRSYSNYLTPRLGMMSPDTWSGFSIYICNLFLNWLIILPLFCVAILGLKILAVIFDALMKVPNWFSFLSHYDWFHRGLSCLNSETGGTPINWQGYGIFCGIPGVILLVYALSFMAENVIFRQGSRVSNRGASQRTFLLSALVPSVLSAIFLAQLLGSDPVSRLFEKLSDISCSPLGQVEGAVVARSTDTESSKDATDDLRIKGGDIITKFDGQTIKTADDLEKLIKAKKVGDKVDIVLNRDEKTIPIQVTLSASPRGTARNEGLIPEDLGAEFTSPDWLVPRYGGSTFIMTGSAVGAFIYVIALLVSWASSRHRVRIASPKWIKSNYPDCLAWALSGIFHGAMVALAFYIWLLIPSAGSVNVLFTDSPALPLTLGVPWLLGAQLFSQFVFVGLSSHRPQSDLDREWLGRAGGWILIAAVSWFAMSFLTFGAVLLLLHFSVEQAADFIKAAAIPISGLSGIATAFLSKSNLTPGTRATKLRAIWVTVANVALAIAAPLFIAGVIFLLSIALDGLLLGHLLFQDFSLTQFGLDAATKPWSKVFDILIPLGIGLGSFIALGCYASYCININRFFLHAFYRNRLIRAFLGASRERKPNAFHGFDLGDNPKMHTLWPPREGSVWQPFHVINMTLNLVSGKKLSWQERKAASFTVSPLHCGTGSAAEFNPRSKRPKIWPCGAYRPASEYGDGISLGTAMAISGAAVSPNMGYHSSAAVTFLMSMLNVRLGWWLGNPSIELGRPYAKDGPALALVPLLAETLGWTTDDRKYIYLSDGGHFENLGLYEMVRRRCRFMLVVDAGCDPSFSFEDLGNAVRKISIDLNVPIKFFNVERLKKRSDDGPVEVQRDYHAVAEVDYRAADSAEGNGIIIYIKPGYHGIESAGIRGYAISQSEFPHQSTLDQWFGESQFESYRALGFEIMDGILELAMKDPDCANDPNLENVFSSLYKRATHLQDVRVWQHPWNVQISYT